VHSTPWVIQVAQRPPGISKPLPDAGMSAAVPPCHCHGLQRAGWVLQLRKRVEQRIVKKTHISSSYTSRRLWFSQVLRRAWAHLIESV